MRALSQVDLLTQNILHKWIVLLFFNFRDNSQSQYVSSIDFGCWSTELLQRPAKLPQIPASYIGHRYHLTLYCGCLTLCIWYCSSSQSNICWVTSCQNEYLFDFYSEEPCFSISLIIECTNLRQDFISSPLIFLPLFLPSNSPFCQSSNRLASSLFIDGC